MGGNLGKNVVIAVSLLVAGFLAAWLRFKPYMGTEGVFTDGDRTIEIERIEQLRYAVWDEPLPMAGELNSRESERAPTISPDGRYVVFVVGERGLGTDLWIADLDARGAATDPRPLALLNSVSDEAAPSFAPSSAGAGVLLFASNRIGGAGGLDLWRARYDRGVFEAPERLGGNINTTSDDTDPAAVPWTGELVFASARERGDEPSARGALRDFDLFMARPLPNAADGRAVWDIEPIDEANTGFDERDPSLSLDGRALLFASDRDGGLGDFDLYRAARAPADLKIGGLVVDWLPPQALVGVNSIAPERHPRPSADGFTLLFSRDDLAGETGWDVWRARSRELVRTPGRPVGWREILILAALLLLALLAALAKRWRGLDIIYKAFLVSLLIHLLLLWWFRDVVPESDPVELKEGDGSRVRIRLVEDPNSVSAQRNVERSGEVEAERTIIEASAAPERSDAAEESQRETAAPAPEAQLALERGAAALASAPQRAAAAEAQRTAEAREVQAEVREATESFQKLSGAAPALEVAAASTDAARAAAAAREVERITEAASGAQAALPTPVAQAGAPLERTDRVGERSDSAPARRQFLVERAETFATLDETGRSPAMDAPATPFERLSSDERRATRPLEVAAAGGATLDGRTEREQEQAAVGVPSAGESTDARLQGELAPTSSAELTRGRPAASTAAAPGFVAAAGSAPQRSDTERGDTDGGEAARGVSVAQPTTDALVERPAGASGAPSFDALAGTETASGDVARVDARSTEASTGPLARERVEPTSLAAASPAPAASTPLARSRRDGRPSAPTFAPSVGSAPERSLTERDLAGRPIDVAQPTDDAGDGSARGAAESQSFDALEGSASATGLLARSREGAREGADERAEPARAAASGTSRVDPAMASPGALKPIERSRGTAQPGPPALARSGASKPVERASTGGTTRDVALANLEDSTGEREARITGAAEASTGTGGAAALELAPSGLDRPLRRSASGATAPGKLSRRKSADGDRLGAPSPLTFDVAVAQGPRPESGIVAPERSKGQWDRTPYQSRSGERKIAALEEFGGTEETERAVEHGLEYLAGRQRDDGRWGRRENDEKYGQPLIGKTGLAALAFMGAGHTPSSGTKYSAVVERALLFLTREQDFDTGHIGNCSSYGHGIATYALGEAYALTKDERLRPALEAAVRQIIDNQIASNDPLLDGGWSYFYPSGRRFDRWPRASVTAWQVMALESAKLGGVSVPAGVFDRARSFLVHCWDPSRGSFRYSHDPSRLSLDYAVLPGSTPASMFALSLLGADLEHEQFEPARRFVLERAPQGYRYTGDDDFVFKARGNLYFWYYGTLSMFRVGGADWKRWNVQMKETLVPAQQTDGSWRPISIYAEFAQDSDRDRVYTTAMNVLALEVYYRYFTPLLKVE